MQRQAGRIPESQQENEDYQPAAHSVKGNMAQKSFVAIP